jgi:hypothetical protein
VRNVANHGNKARREAQKEIKFTTLMPYVIVGCSVFPDTHAVIVIVQYTAGATTDEMIA